MLRGGDGLKHFGFSFAFTAAALAAAGWWGLTSSGGWQGALGAVMIAAILGIMEISLSFDNAVVNASVLRTWNRFWQTMFLTIGIFVAVFGMRLLFPLVIVSVTADMGMLEVWNMALDSPEEYATHLMAHHAEISAFGAMFLLLVFLNYFLDDEKDTHWLHWIESRAGVLGRIDAIAITVALAILLASISFVDDAHKAAALIAGVWGIFAYLLVDFISSFLETGESEGVSAGDVVKRGGIGAFLYLEMLDASFSFDGVIAAFAVTKDIVIIMLGLGIGALFVRSMTLYLVKKDTLSAYIYLEHGAHWAIGILALIMLANMQFHVPELITGLIGVAFIVAALTSSVRYKRAHSQTTDDATQ